MMRALLSLLHRHPDARTPIREIGWPVLAAAAATWGVAKLAQLAGDRQDLLADRLEELHHLDGQIAQRRDELAMLTAPEAGPVVDDGDPFLPLYQPSLFAGARTNHAGEAPACAVTGCTRPGNVAHYHQPGN